MLFPPPKPYVWMQGSMRFAVREASSMRRRRYRDEVRSTSRASDQTHVVDVDTCEFKVSVSVWNHEHRYYYISRCMLKASNLRPHAYIDRIHTYMYVIIRTTNIQHAYIQRTYLHAARQNINCDGWSFAPISR
jgi:hypothetical protein